MRIPRFLRHTLSIAVASLWLSGGLIGAHARTAAQVAAQALPANYKTILDNPDLLVMRVHYGPHEFVAMHDHSAYPSVFVYLNDSGVIQIDHANGESVKRPPTHTGAFRVAPGMIERHSITNLSSIPSDFLRIEFKRIPPTDIQETFRGAAPVAPAADIHTDYQNPGLRIERIVCPATSTCQLPPASAPSILIALTPLTDQAAKSDSQLKPGDIVWSPKPSDKPATLSAAAEALRITLLYAAPH
jgi:hypothetical protein